MQRVRAIVSLGLLAAAWPAVPGVWAQTPAPQAEVRSIVIPRVTAPPELKHYVANGNGSASSEAGAISTATGVAVTEFRQREPGDGTPVSQETAAYLSYDDENLYIVFVCKDERSEIRASIARREDIDADDAVVVYLDTFHDKQRAYMFMVNPRGVQLDGIRTEGQDDDLSFDAVWHSEGELTEDGYVVRMAIPFRSLRFRRSAQQTWGLALGRLIKRDNEESYWPYITERESDFVPQFGTAEGLSDISPGLNIQLNPYATASRARNLNDNGEIPLFQTLNDQRVGLDAKLVLRDALTLDGTVNPDFSQVEGDDPQVSQNQRFEVFFPEKRPFFLENAGYFQTPINLFFTRRIQDPGAGMRLTGKAGGWAIGVIGMNDRAPDEIDVDDPEDPLAGRDARVGALRVQRALGEESTLGVLVTDRTLASSFNRMVSLDSRLRFGEAWALAGQVIRSENRDVEDQRLAGFGGLAQLEHDGRSFDYAGSYLQFDDDFTAPLGFVERVGIRQTEHEMEYTWRPDGDALVSFGPKVAVLYNWDKGMNLLDREVGASFAVELVGDTEIEVEHTRVFERFAGLPFRPRSTQLSLSTEWLKWMAVDASYEWGSAVNHDPAEDEETGDPLPPSLLNATEAEVQLTFRPMPALRWDVAFVHGRLKTNVGQQVARELEARSRLSYQFSRFLSVRGIVDYEAEDADPTLFDADEREREWRFDVLLTYLVRPGTALHVGFADEYENVELVGTPPSVEFSRSPTTSIGRQLFVKVSYLLRF
jgi:hypothetical protein